MKVIAIHRPVDEELFGCCLDCRRSFSVIKSHVLDFYHNIEAYDSGTLAALSPVELYRLYQDLDQVAHLKVSRHLAEQVLEDPEIEMALPTIRSYYSAFFDHHERHLARDLCKAEGPWSVLENYSLSPRYKALIDSQVEAINLSSDKVMAFVGCGPFPLSLIFLSRFYGIRSIGLDVNPQAVSLARRCILRLGLENDITVMEGDEPLLRELEWDAVLVAALAEPKPRIFGNLRTILEDKGPRPICYRTYTGMRAVLYRPVQPGDVRGFRKVRKIMPTGKVNNTLVILEME